MTEVLQYVIPFILGGGLWKAVESLLRALNESKEKRELASILGAKMPGEIESVSVATMTIALESAERRIRSLEEERTFDREIYQNRIAELADQLKRVRSESADQLRQVRSELAVMEERVRNLLSGQSLTEGGT